MQTLFPCGAKILILGFPCLGSLAVNQFWIPRHQSSLTQLKQPLNGVFSPLSVQCSVGNESVVVAIGSDKVEAGGIGED